ncbi:hypothetical protein GN956_G15345 [Arapaima gigas]
MPSMYRRESYRSSGNTKKGQVGISGPDGEPAWVPKPEGKLSSILHSEWLLEWSPEELPEPDWDLSEVHTPPWDLEWGSEDVPDPGLDLGEVSKQRLLKAGAGGPRSRVDQPGGLWVQWDDWNLLEEAPMGTPQVKGMLMNALQEQEPEVGKLGATQPLQLQQPKEGLSPALLKLALRRGGPEAGGPITSYG